MSRLDVSRGPSRIERLKAIARRQAHEGIAMSYDLGSTLSEIFVGWKGRVGTEYVIGHHRSPGTLAAFVNDELGMSMYYARALAKVATVFTRAEFLELGMRKCRLVLTYPSMRAEIFAMAKRGLSAGAIDRAIRSSDAPRRRPTGKQATRVVSFVASERPTFERVLALALKLSSADRRRLAAALFVGPRKASDRRAA